LYVNLSEHSEQYNLENVLITNLLEGMDL
jgi:hypothetical protein